MPTPEDQFKNQQEAPQEQPKPEQAQDNPWASFIERAEEETGIDKPTIEQAVESPEGESGLAEKLESQASEQVENITKESESIAKQAEQVELPEEQKQEVVNRAREIGNEANQAQEELSGDLRSEVENQKKQEKSSEELKLKLEIEQFNEKIEQLLGQARQNLENTFGSIEEGLKVARQHYDMYYMVSGQVSMEANYSAEMSAEDIKQGILRSEKLKKALADFENIRFDSENQEEMLKYTGKIIYAQMNQYVIDSLERVKAALKNITEANDDSGKRRHDIQVWIKRGVAQHNLIMDEDMLKKSQNYLW